MTAFNDGDLEGLEMSVEGPGYVHEIPADPEPQWDEQWEDQYSPVDEAEDIILSTRDMRLIKDNLGTYLATVGMTVGLIDPYCGAVLRDNLDEMVKSWAEVIGHYPGAARLFMAKGGGKLMAWIDALTSTWPVLVAVYEHHLSNTVDAFGQKVKDARALRASEDFATQPDFNIGEE